MLTWIFRCLDGWRFLGIPMWEFGFHSFFHRYGRIFLWKMVLLHPRRFYRAIRRARELWSVGPQDGIWRTGPEGRYDLVAASYCQKPVGPDGGCPVGRFNHRCLVAENGIEGAPAVCRTCPIQAIVGLARRNRADFYIMTSGLDIAEHLFLPSMQGSRAQRGLFFLCSYSSHPFLLAMLLAGLEGDLLTFCCGDCMDHRDFSLADRGEKDTQTAVASRIWSKFVPPVLAPKEVRFERLSEVYRIV